MFAASIQGEGVLAKSKSQSGLGTMQPDSPWENLSVGVGPVCQTPLSSGLSKWELGPRPVEQSPILVLLFFILLSIFRGCFLKF